MWDSKTVHDRQNMHKYTSFTQSHGIVYVHQDCVMIDYCTRYKIHWFISAISLQMYAIYSIMDINATFWHKAKVYFTCIRPLLWLISVPIMNKIIFFFSKISQQTHKIDDKYCHNYSNLAWGQMIFYMHQQDMVPDYCTVYE